jgi:hypothetical protein
MSGSRTLVLVATVRSPQVAPSVKLSYGLHLRQERQTSAGNPPDFPAAAASPGTKELSSR